MLSDMILVKCRAIFITSRLRLAGSTVYYMALAKSLQPDAQALRYVTF